MNKDGTFTATVETLGEDGATLDFDDENLSRRFFDGPVVRDIDGIAKGDRVEVSVTTGFGEQTITVERIGVVSEAERMRRALYKAGDALQKCVYLLEGTGCNGDDRAGIEEAIQSADEALPEGYVSPEYDDAAKVEGSP